VLLGSQRSGKSDWHCGLIDHGAKLVADDRTICSPPKARCMPGTGQHQGADRDTGLGIVELPVRAM